MVQKQVEAGGEKAAALTLSLRQWCRRHPVSTDAAGVVGLVALTGADVLHHGSVIGLVWQAALWLPVIFRRTAPVVVFFVVGVVAAGQWGFYLPLGGDLAVLIVLYSVAAYRSRILAVASAAAVEVGVVLAVLRFGQELWPRYLLLLTILVVAASSLGVTQQARRAHLVALTDRADRLEREGQQQAQLAAAAERTRIAREMHDIVAHSLSVMITLADGATLTDDVDQGRTAMRQVATTGREALADTRRVLDVLRTESDQTRTAMRQVATTGREALADTRRVLDVLRTESDQTDLAPLPGISSLEALLTSVRATGLHTSLAVSGTKFTIPGAAQLAIYRIVQEALTNTLKHAREVTRSAVRLTYDDPLVRVEVTDDGTPVEGRESKILVDSTHGLLGIRERAALFGGSFAAGHVPTGGWRVAVTIRLPVPARTATPPDQAFVSPPPAPIAR